MLANFDKKALMVYLYIFADIKSYRWSLFQLYSSHKMVFHGKDLPSVSLPSADYVTYTMVDTE